jgi:uncharacterized membrane protein
MRRQLKLYLLALSCAIGLTAWAPAEEQQLVSFETLDPPGSTFTSAMGINAHGEIVGRYVDANGVTHAWLRSGGAFTSIDFPGAISTLAYDINARGDIVGPYQSVAGGPVHGFLLRRAEFTSIDVPGATGTSAFGINAHGAIVGAYCDGTIDPCPFLGNGNRGYLLQGDQFTTIDFPGATATVARKINVRGEIAGFYVDPSGAVHGFLLSGEEFTSIDFPDAAETEAHGINSRGDIVGAFCYMPCEPIPIGGHHGYVLHDGQSASIDFPGARATRAIGINGRRDIVGAYRDFAGGNHGFLMSSGKDEEREEDKE